MVVEAVGAGEGKEEARREGGDIYGFSLDRIGFELGLR